MGLLDDAIREHLDLKRRRGADPTEVARLEQEALGPVRREPAPAGGPEEAHDAGVHDEAEHDEDAHEQERHEAEPHGQPHGEDDPPAPAEAHDLPATAPADEHEAPDPRASDVVHQPTTEFHVEEDHDDVLEETPDFLQEAPEHDRLWFEQRPPRDFDFDG